VVRDDAGAWAGEPFAEQGELPSIRVGSFHRNNLTRYIAVKGRSSRFRRIRRLAGSSAGSPARLAGESKAAPDPPPSPAAMSRFLTFIHFVVYNCNRSCIYKCK
jgi:hypothetical protein